ncbi:MAG: hypothetical protein NTX78_03120 [Rhodoluna sp.]|nr:hypothetical protein [Rhodoluna sp.]
MVDLVPAGRGLNIFPVLSDHAWHKGEETKPTIDSYRKISQSIRSNSKVGVLEGFQWQAAGSEKCSYREEGTTKGPLKEATRQTA